MRNGFGRGTDIWSLSRVAGIAGGSDRSVARISASDAPHVIYLSDVVPDTLAFPLTFMADDA
jgi:hypothetical protein